VHTLITDDGAPKEMLDHIRGQGVEVLIADTHMREKRSAA
jgi:hypothetical protein